MGGLWVSVAGMMSRAAEVAVIASDVANVGTPGFRQLLVGETDVAPAAAYASLPFPPAAAVGPDVLEGGGVVAGPVTVDTAEGPLQQTGRPFDLAVLGDGYLAFGLPGGGRVYTRGGRLHADAGRTLVDDLGRPLLDVAGHPVRLPAAVTALSVQPDGTLSASVAGQEHPVARLALVLPQNPQGMLPADGGAWTATPAAGTLRSVAPGSGGAGRLVFRVLEGSNVDLAALLPQLLAAQRAYAANGRAFTVALHLWSLANQIPQQ